MSTESEAWANLLNKEPGERGEKVRWLDRELDLIQAEAEASFSAVEPSTRAVQAKMRALIIRWWRRHYSQHIAPRKRARILREAPEDEPGEPMLSREETQAGLAKIAGRIGRQMPE